MERSTSDLEATMPTSPQPGTETIFKTKIKLFCSKLNDYMDTVGRPTSDGEGTLPTYRPTTIPNLGFFFFFCCLFVCLVC